MNPLLNRLMQPYMAPFDGEGGDSGGGDTAVADRGDEPTVDTEDGAPATEGVATDEADDESPRDEKGRFQKKDSVPKERFNEAVGKERAAREAAEARSRQLEERLKQEEKSVDVQKMEEQIDALEKQHAAHLLDGESEKAAAVMKQIRMSERKIAAMESDSKVASATTAAVEQVRMEAAIAKLEADYDVLNPNSDDYDQDLVDFVVAEQNRLITREGMSTSKALLTAGEKIMKRMKAAAGSSDEPGKGLANATKGADRKSEQVKKNLDTASRQPASMKDAGKDSDKVGAGVGSDVSKMSADEFAALPESTRAKLRGDVL